MRSFIPEEDRAKFEAFLIENSLQTDQSDSSAGPVRDPPPPPQSAPPPPPPGVGVGEGRRGRRGRNRGGGARVADMDKFLADIDSHTQAMMDTSNF